MPDIIYDDPIWEYLLATKLQPYLPAVRKFWSEYENMKITTTGIQDLIYNDIDCPPGLQIRVTSTAVHSPIKHVQIFPFVPTSYLQISGVPGGALKMVDNVCRKGLTLEEFTIVEKHNLPSTYHKGQILAFVPTTTLANAKELGKYVYLTVPELCSLATGVTPRSVQGKCSRYIEQFS